MKSEHQQAVASYLLALADDELILAHRHSEWTGHGPILEEDIAFTNIALDELGHAQTWYRLYEELTGAETDKLVFFREGAAYRCVQMVALPNGDWAFSMLRQYLFDTYEKVLYEQLTQSSYAPLAAAAAKLRLEEIYHLRHTHAWVLRLGQGTAESKRRLQQALDSLWPYAHQLFVAGTTEELLVEQEIIPAKLNLMSEWLTLTSQHLAEAGLTIPKLETPIQAARGEHREDLSLLLAEMQSVARQDPAARW